MVKPGNGCAAAMGIEAGYYSGARQYFVSPSGNDSNDGTTSALAKTIGAATSLLRRSTARGERRLRHAPGLRSQHGWHRAV